MAIPAAAISALPAFMSPKILKSIGHFKLGFNADLISSQFHQIVFKPKKPFWLWKQVMGSTRVRTRNTPAC
jgi:hypothetical protein